MPVHRRRFLAIARIPGLLVVSLLLFACGGSAPAKSAERPPEAADVTGADAEDGARKSDPVDREARDFEKEEQRVASLLGDEEAEGEEPAIVPSPPARPEVAGQPPPVAEMQTRDRCTVACKALASMRRAADRVCEMTGEEDPRCANLRERVDKAREIVRSKCPRCEAARE